MQNSSKKSRSERAASLRTRRFDWRDWIDRLKSLDLIQSAFIVVLAGLILSVALKSWEPPFPYRIGYVPQRAIPARIPFQIEDEAQTDGLKVQAARDVLCVYENRKEPLVELRGELQDVLFAIRDYQINQPLDESQKANLEYFGSQSEGPNSTSLDRQEIIDCIRKTLATDADISKFDAAIQKVFSPLEEFGVIQLLRHDPQKGNQRFIKVIQQGNDDQRIEVDVSRVRKAELIITLKGSLKESSNNSLGMDQRICSLRLYIGFSLLNCQQLLPSERI